MSGILERLETKIDKLIALYGSAATIEPMVAVQGSMDNEPGNCAQLAENAQHAPSTSTDPYAGVDKDGVTWDARIHSKAKEPKSVTTGKWKRKKGIQDQLYTTVTAELQANASAPSITGPFFWVDTVTNVSNTCDTRAEMDQLLTVPTTKEITMAEFDALLLIEAPTTGPKAPLAPKAPSAPNAPVAPKAPVENVVKAEVISLIKELTAEHEVEPNDITGLMLEITGFDTIAKISDGKLVEFRESLTGWEHNVNEAQKAVDAMTVIATPHNLLPNLNDGIECILEPHDADCVGIVHYSAIAGVNDQLQAYLKTWQAI